MNYVKIACLFLSIVLFNNIFAQNEVKEVSYDISRKAKNGYLGGVETNQANNTFDLVYVLPSSQKKVKIETYTYDIELGLKDTKKEEWDVDKVRSRYKWFNFRGDVYYTNGLTASTTMGGKLVFRKKLITWKYRWWYGTYIKNVKMLEKVKPTSDAGEKYYFRGGAYEVDRDSSILVIAGRQDSPKDALGSYLHYDLIKCDNEVNISVLSKIDFNEPYAPIFAEPLKDENHALNNDDLPRDWIVVFAPQGNINKKTTAVPNKLVYYRISPEGNIKEKVTFDAPTNGWRILEVYEKNNELFFYGPSITKDLTGTYIDKIYKTQLVATTSADEEEKATENTTAKSGGMFSALKNMGNTLAGNKDMGVTQEAIDAMLDEMNFTGFTLGKLVNGKFEFIKENPVADFNSKAVKPEGQKKIVDFNGKRFETFNIYFTSKNDILINGQDFKVAKQKPFGPDYNAGSRLYQGVYMFQFDGQGNLKHNYGVFLDQKETAGFFNRSPLTSDMFPATSYLTESADKSKLYWMMNICRATHEETDEDYSWFTKTTTKTWAPLFSVQYGTLDLDKGTASDFKLLGEAEKKKFYLFPSKNVVELGKYIIYLSETEKGDKLLLSRMDISK